MEKGRAIYRRWGFYLSRWWRRMEEFLRWWRQIAPFSGWWWLEMWVRLMELGGVFVSYETLAEWIKWNTRPLTGAERTLVAPYFQGHIRLDLVRMDSWAFIGSAQRRFAYVSLHTINCWRELGASVLIHELVHVWQYERLGAAYLVRALRAQHSKEGYNYGGVAMIRDFLDNNRTFLEFNLEQQADIVMDYFRLKNGWKPQWGSGGLQDIGWYEQILAPFFTST